MKRLFLVLFTIVTCSVASTAFARGRASAGGWSRHTVYVEKEKVVYVLCAECIQHSPEVEPPDSAKKIRAKIRFGTASFIVDVGAYSVEITVDENKEVCSMSISKGDKEVFSAHDVSGSPTIEPTQKVRVNFRKWQSFVNNHVRIFVPKETN